MKTPPLLIVAAMAVLTARGQAPGPSGPAGPYSAEQLDQLLAPIALYPDPIVALILPASTYPADITLADRYLLAHGDPGSIPAEPWDASVKGLTHYPVLIKWLDDNLAWTQALGQAVVSQQPDVLKAIQDLRARALASGALVSIPQERVVTVGGIIRIVPPDQSTIYLPEYDPDLVYGGPGLYQGPPIAFGAGYPAGDWLAFQCDWTDFAIWTGPWHGRWDRPRDGRDWRPQPNQVRQVGRDLYRPPIGIPRPRPTAGSHGGPGVIRNREGPPAPRRQEPPPARTDDDKRDRH
jgi:hypothetical protein